MEKQWRGFHNVVWIFIITSYTTSITPTLLGSSNKHVFDIGHTIINIWSCQIKEVGVDSTHIFDNIGQDGALL
jgi:hypothetical protein